VGNGNGSITGITKTSTHFFVGNVRTAYMSVGGDIGFGGGMTVVNTGFAKCVYLQNL
jgi:hypothetical protein